MKHITWQPGDIITDEKWNNIQNNYELKFKHFNIPYAMIDQDGDSFPVLNTTDTILENKIANGYICYFIMPRNTNGGDMFYLRRIIDIEENILIPQRAAEGDSTIITYYEFSNFNIENTIDFIFNEELNKLVYAVIPPVSHKKGEI